MYHALAVNGPIVGINGRRSARATFLNRRGKDPGVKPAYARDGAKITRVQRLRTFVWYIAVFRDCRFLLVFGMYYGLLAPVWYVLVPISRNTLISLWISALDETLRPTA